jgi:hypothetical protein
LRSYSVFVKNSSRSQGFSDNFSLNFFGIVVFKSDFSSFVNHLFASFLALASIAAFASLVILLLGTIFTPSRINARCVDIHIILLPSFSFGLISDVDTKYVPFFLSQCK